MDAGTPTIEARGLGITFRGRDVLVDVDLQARAGEIVMIAGRSGGGKTTLLRAIKGILQPQRGHLSVLGAPPRVDGRADPRIGFIPQQLGLVRAETVLANTLTGACSRTGLLRSLLGRFAPEEYERAHAILDQLGIGEYAQLPVRMLSGGQRQRVAIARSLMQQPSILLADEFVSQLDLVTAREILEVTRAIARRGVTVLMTTHEVEMAREFADRIVMLQDGRVAVDAPATDVDVARIREVLR
ncbi:MAG: ATP-binding cassette domain-containing protein [Dehalococcoidia bacterium]